jgi:hypothetical protein
MNYRAHSHSAQRFEAGERPSTLHKQLRAKEKHEMKVIKDSRFTILCFEHDYEGILALGSNLTHIGWVFDLFEEDGNIEGEPAAFVPDLQVAALLRDLNNMHNENVYFALPPNYSEADFKHCCEQVPGILKARALARQESMQRVKRMQRRGEDEITTPNLRR